jgi:hypothetical protein
MRPYAFLTNICKALVGAIIIFSMWFTARSLVWGGLTRLQQLNAIQRHDHFCWISPDLILPNARGARVVRIIGFSYQSQTLSLNYGTAESGQYGIARGPFDISITLDPRFSDNIPEIRSNFYFVPAKNIGSRDTRQLSYQLFEVQIDGKKLPLEATANKETGAYGIEPYVNRITPEEVLTRTWDASWYHSIAAHGYRYSGDNSIQQNVAWPFLYPSVVRLYSAISGSTISGAMLTVNAAGSLLTMLGLFVLGRTLGLSVGAACISPAWLAFNPFNIFLFGGFSESLFLLFETLFLIALVKRWWLTAALILIPLVGTRFIGLVLIGWLLIYWTSEQHFKELSFRLIATPLSLMAIGLSGIIADFVVKGCVTGYPLAGFLIRRAWAPSPSGVSMGVFDLKGLPEGNYLPVLLSSFATLGFTAFAIPPLLRAGYHKESIVVASGISIVVATLILNPEIQSSGRYLLPLAPSIVGLLGFQPLRYKACTVVALLTIIGVGFTGLIMMNFYQGLPPF